MAIYKRKTLKRKTYRRKTYKKKSLAGRAYAMVKSIKRTYKPELKKVDSAQSTMSVPTSAYFQPLHSIAQGSDYNQREGNKVVIRYITARGFIKHNNTATDGQVLRVMLVWDKQQISDTTPTAGDLFSVAAESVTSPMNPRNAGRFKVLWSKIYIVDPSNEIKSFYLNKRLSMPIRYNGTANTDIQKNGLYLVISSSDNINKPTFTRDVRTSFIDN